MTSQFRSLPRFAMVPLLLLLTVVDLTAQMPAGREFVVAFPALWRRAELIDPGDIRIMVMATRETDVTLRWSGPGGTVLDRVSIQAGGRGMFATPMLFQTQNVMQTNFDRDSAEANQRSFVIEATEPISVFVLYDHYVEREFNGRSKTEMWSVPPVNAYDTAWIVTVDSGTSDWGDRTGFLVIASEDGTVFSWEPSVRWGYVSPLEPVAGTISLQRHQVYQVLSWERGGAEANLSGTRITSNRPVTVLPFTLGSDVIPSRKSTLAEHQYSINQAGRLFYAAPPYPLDTTRIRLVAQYDGTTIFLNDSEIDSTFDAGDFLSIDTATAIKIEASRPIVAMQMLYYPDGEDPRNLATRRGASSMALLPPVENYREKLQWINPRLENRPEESGNSWRHYVLITTPATVAESVRLDGDPVAFNITHVDSQYVSAVVPLNPKHYVLEADGPVGAIAYGMAIDDAYAYLAGEGVRSIIATDTDTLSFVTCDTIADLDIGLRSEGNLLYRIDSIVADGITLSAVRNPPSFPTLMPPGRELELRLRFALPSARRYSGTLRIYTDALNESVTTIPFRITRDSARLAVPDAIDFGRIDASQTTADTLIRVVNEGEDSLRITTLFSTNGRFEIIEPTELPLVLGPGEADTILVRATPRTGVQEEGRIEILGDPCFVPLSIDLRIYRGSGPALDRPATIDLGGELCDDEPGRDTTITLRATGDEPLEIDRIEISGDDATTFTLLVDPSPKTLVPGEEATVTIRYEPTGYGTHRADLSVVSNDVRGLPPIRLIGRRDTATIVPGVREMTFPRLASCASPVIRELRLSNDIGTVPSELSDLSFRVGEAYSIVGGLPGPLAPLGGERIIEIRFVPPSDGDFVDTLVIEGGPCGIEELVILRGSRRSPELTSSFESHDFGSLYICDSPADSTTLRLTNTGEITDTIFGAVQSGDGAFSIVGIDGATISWPVILAPGAGLDIRLKFAPVGAGNISGDITFEWGPCERSTVIAFGGSSVEPTVDLSTDLLEYGPVDVDSPGLRMSLLLSNRSRLPRVIRDIDFGSVADEYRLVDPLPLPATVPPGGSMAIVIEFDPTSEGSRADFATIFIDAPCAQELRVGLSGEGTGDDALVGELLLSVPDFLDGVVNETTAIPIVVENARGVGQIGVDGVELALYWAASLLFPEGLTIELDGWNGEIVDSRIEGDRRRLHLRFSGQESLKSGDTLGSVSALVLLGDRDTTEITIELLEVSMPPSSLVTVTLDHGGFTTFGICRIDGQRLLASSGPLRPGAPTPNPGSEIITVPIGLERAGRLVVRLFDPSGIERSRPVDSQLAAGEYSLPIDVGSLPTGLYICRFEIEGVVVERKVLVRR